MVTATGIPALYATFLTMTSGHLPDVVSLLLPVRREWRTLRRSPSSALMDRAWLLTVALSFWAPPGYIRASHDASISPLLSYGES